MDIQGFVRHSSFLQRTSWILFVFVGPLYLWWHVLAFLEWRMFSVALPLFTAELFYTFHTFFFLFTTREFWIPVHHTSNNLGSTTVDICIPTINEPDEVIAMTVEAACKVRGVRNVLVLDDGHRQSVETLTRSKGAMYYARGDNTHAKAGNMNFGLAHSDAEFIAFFDVDHVPKPEFIERTLGYFQDKRLAFVQTPQVFYNLDSFQHKIVPGKEGWNEQAMFYGSIQPGKNRYNSAFFVGTNALFRRKALDDIGGFATGTATEDVHTSLRLHARGWRSLYVPEILALGLAPVDLKEYYRQRVRWGAGSLGLLLRSKDSPLFSRRLSLMQRICYIMSTSFFLSGVFKLIYFFVPVSVLLFQRSVIHFEIMASYFSITISYLFFSIFTVTLQSRKTYYWWYTELFNVINTFAHLASLKGVLRIQKKFSPSVKKKAHFERAGVTYVLYGLASLLLAADVVGVVRILSMPELPLLQNSVSISVFWNTVNLIFVTGGIIHIMKNERYRKRLMKTPEVIPDHNVPTYGTLPWAFS